MECSGVAACLSVPAEQQEYEMLCWLFLLQGVRLYDVRKNFLISQYHHKAAVLDCCFSDDAHAFSGGLDRSIKMYGV
jgi:hypothetical protein